MSKTNQFIHLSVADSTNNFAAKLINDGLGSDNMVIMADFQSHGKGQYGNSWQSDKGLNLTFSLIKHFDMLSVEESQIITWAISISLVKTLRKYSVPSFVKWPNDIMVGNKKIAGILIENRIKGNKIEWSIIGVGLNVNQTIFDLPNATSLFLETQKKTNLKLLLSETTKAFSAEIIKPFVNLKEEYNSHLYLKNIPSSFQDKSGLFTGTIQEVNSKGCILIKKPGNVVVEYRHKEISFQNAL